MLGRKIMQYLEKLGADVLPTDGVPASQIARGIAGTTLDAVREEVETLLGEGMVYTTIDSDQ